MSGDEYCSICENFPCLGNHPPDADAEADEEYERAMEALIRRGLIARADLESEMLGPDPGRPICFSPFSDSPIIREGLARRAAEERDRREWIEGVRRRLGLVSEVHRCRVYEPNPDDDWAWSCQRAGCGASDYGYPIQPAAFAEALAHARAFVPEPVEEAPVTELDLLAFEAAWARMRAEQDAFAAALPARVADVTELVKERFAGKLPGGMRFEWVADGE